MSSIIWRHYHKQNIIHSYCIRCVDSVTWARTCAEASFEILLANNLILYPNYSKSLKNQQFIEYLSNLSSNYNVQVFRIQIWIVWSVFQLRQIWTVADLVTKSILGQHALNNYIPYKEWSQWPILYIDD